MSSTGATARPPDAPRSPEQTSTVDTLFSYLQILDAVPDTAAILGADGVIVAVNKAWRDFGVANGARVAFGVGINYRNVCVRGAADGEPDAAHMLDQLNAVQSGEADHGEFEYECSGPQENRWFMTRVTPVAGTDLTLVTHVDITRLKHAQASLRKLAEQDTLTGLANRVGFLAAVENAERDGADQAGEMGVVYLDLDDFKAVNDTHGHALGDELLRVVAHRLRAATKQHDVVARLGGDEFAVLVWHIGPHQLTRLAERLTAAVSRPVSLRGVTVTVGASAGTAMCGSGGTILETLEAADAAMYGMKKAGRTDDGARADVVTVTVTLPSLPNSPRMRTAPPMGLRQHERPEAVGGPRR